MNLELVRILNYGSRIRVNLNSGSRISLNLEFRILNLESWIFNLALVTPFAKTTLLRKQLISPILFGRSKIDKKVLAVERYANLNVSVKASFAHYFSKLLC